MADKHTCLIKGEKTSSRLRFRRKRTGSNPVVNLFFWGGGVVLGAQFAEIRQHQALYCQRVMPERYSLSPDRRIRALGRLLDRAGILPGSGLDIGVSTAN